MERARIVRRWDVGPKVIAASIALVLGVTTLTTFTGLAGGGAAEAANAADFRPGNIISDQNFYDGAAMTEAQIQAFLTSRGSVLAGYTNSTASRSRLVSETTGNLRCEAFTGGTNLKASTIIYRAQVACGISAKVILVTLQKEQGLISSSSAGQSALDRAMGMACPDTAPCAEYALGFGNQVYEGAKQLKTYKAAAFGRQPGTNTIPWNPSASCGSSTFVIENYATAALYNYTPYRPNAAAMANYPGVGDSCSSYGNRNFWFYYTDWFGPTSATDPIRAINDRYTALGGASGVLGAAGPQPNCTYLSASCTRTFAHGVIYWAQYSEAVAVAGVIGDLYLAQGGPAGPLGPPALEASAVTDPNGNGTAQKFANGFVHSSSAGTFATSSALMTAYSGAGWLRGYLGWPVSAEKCGTGAGCIQEFAGGALVRGATGPGAVLPADIRTLYTANGGPTGAFGYPVGIPTAVVDGNGNGTAMSFRAGTVHSSSAGAFFTSTRFMAAYSAAGWLRGYLGWPSSAEECGSPAGYCQQSFAGGGIFTTSSGGVGTAPAAVWSTYVSAGGATGSLGLPSAGASAVTDPKGNGYAQVFAGGYIHSSPAGAFVTSNKLMPSYSAAGWVRGSLGWPTGAETCTASECSQQFSGGQLVKPTSAPSYIVQTITNAQIASLYSTLGGATGSLGRATGPTSAVTDPKGNGFAQVFEGGYIHSSAAGTFMTSNKLMPSYSAAGWVRGSLGWPTAAEVCTASGCSQQFVGGELVKPASSGAYVVPAITDSQISALYTSLGGAGGVLGRAVGATTAVTDPHGNGVVQAFVGGYIHSSASGTFMTSSRLMAAYSAAGWLRGAYGWPTAAEVCTPSACTQQFAGGTLSR